MSAGAIPTFDPDKFMATRTAPAKVSPDAASSFDPDAFMAKKNAPNPDREVRDHLKDEGFLDSVWNVVKSPVSIAGSLFNGDFGRETLAQRQRMEELQKSGTPEQKRQFAKEIILKNVPGASTAYKVEQGNIPGALGDVTGMAALGLAPKIVEAAGDIPVGRIAKATVEGTKAGVMNAPIVGKPLRAGVRAFSKSLEESAPKAGETAATVVPPSPGEALAKAQGQDWTKMPPQDKALLEKIAAGQANAAAQPTSRPPQAPSTAGTA